MRDINKKFVDAFHVETGTELDSEIQDISQCRSTAVIAKWTGDADGDITLMVGADEASLIPYEAATSMGGADGEKMWNLKEEAFSVIKLTTDNTTSGESDVDSWVMGKP